MITRKTVLILGAGAGMPYGLPSGSELLGEIKGGISQESKPLFKKLKQMGHAPSYIEEFHDNLIYADPLSIDAFLETRDEFLEIGKQTIAYCLIPREDKDVFFKMNKTEHPSWYQYLFSKLRSSSPDEFVNNNLAIITFNYDRSLEYYLFIVLQHTHKLSREKCASILTEIPIIHVHGSLGALPYFVEQKSTRQYGPSQFTPQGAHITDKELFKASGEIKVISENIGTSPEFEKAHSEMANAEKIFFLGFGYHETNLKRLRINFVTVNPNKRVYGTWFGMGKSDCRIVESRWKIKFLLKYPPLKTYEFLRDQVILE